MRLPWKRRADAPAIDTNAGSDSTGTAQPPAADGTPVADAAPVAPAPEPAQALTPADGPAPAAPLAPGAEVPAPSATAAPAAPLPVTPPPPAPRFTPAERMARAAAQVNLPAARGPEPTAPFAPVVADAAASGATAPDGAAPAAESPAAAPVTAPAAPVVTGVPVVKRRGLIPAWVPWVAGGVTALLIVAGVLIALFMRADVVRVPSLSGLDQRAARQRLQELGLRYRVGDKRFSASAPPQSIIDQEPAPGTQVPEGTVVVVAISAGSESFSMPDVVGDTLDAARKRLRERGLTVEFQTVPSEKDQGTVISTVPSPGMTVQTGDTVRLTVAAGTSPADTLLPSDLKNKTFVLDPAPMPAGGGADTTMDIARRVRALLEAAGARVVLTRQVTDVGDAANTLARARRAKETSGTALIGFSVASSGQTGLAVVSVENTGTAQATYLKSLALTQALTDGLKASFPNVGTATASGDTILTDTGVPAVRVRLGSTQASADRLTFTDPEWADNVARSIYRAIAQVYGGR